MKFAGFYYLSLLISIICFIGVNVWGQEIRGPDFDGGERGHDEGASGSNFVILPPYFSYYLVSLFIIDTVRKTEGSVTTPNSWVKSTSIIFLHLFSTERKGSSSLILLYVLRYMQWIGH